MKSVALKRLESLLEARNLAGTLPPAWEAPVAVVSSGIARLDARLEGGWRRGELSEIVGPQSAGRTGVLLATLAGATAEGAVAALIDPFDRADPASAAAAGVELHRLLWVRGTALTVELARPALVEHAVRRAIRAFDLVIRAGGFSVVALDLADVPARDVRALPYTTWRRLSYANEGRPTAGLLVGEAPMGRSARGASVVLEGTPTWAGTSDQSRRFEGFEIRMPGMESASANRRRFGEDGQVVPSVVRACGLRRRLRPAPASMT